jgi:hypothetical protein
LRVAHSSRRLAGLRMRRFNKSKWLFDLFARIMALILQDFLRLEVLKKMVVGKTVS